MAPRKQSTSDGLKVFVEPSDSLPVTEVDILFRFGSVADPSGLEGLTRLTMLAMRAGTRDKDRSQVEAALSLLGARLSVDVSWTWARFQGAVLARNLEPFLALLGDLLLRPAFRASEIARLKRETLAAIEEGRDDDRSLCAKAMRQKLFGGHLFGRSVVGTEQSYAQLTRKAVVEHHAKMMRAGNIIVGGSGHLSLEGDTSTKAFEERIAHMFRKLPAGALESSHLRTPKVLRGRHVVLVDKPDRNQVQLGISTLGTHAGAQDVEPLLLANTIFGGTFSSRLTQEVRAKRGWSYGAQSRLTLDRVRDTWSMWTFPTSTYAAKCAALKIRLLEKWVAKGVTAKELAFAKSHLLGSHCFETDTASKRLEDRMDIELFKLPKNYPRRHLEKLRGTTRPDVQEALHRRISPHNLVITAVATASEVEAKFARLPDLKSLEVVPYTSL